jgi:hypothetical protein
MASNFETETEAESTTGTGPTDDSSRPQTKLGAGRQNPVDVPYDFRAEETAPFDVSALYCYLIVQAEQQYLSATVEDIVWLFEAEFASTGAVPESVVSIVTDRFQNTGIAAAPPTDELRLDAVITIFVDEYSHALAAAPGTLPDPRGVPTRPVYSYCSDIATQLRQRLRSLLRGPERL